jgi:hypothetical protein
MAQGIQGPLAVEEIRQVESSFSNEFLIEKSLA